MDNNILLMNNDVLLMDNDILVCDGEDNFRTISRQDLKNELFDFCKINNGFNKIFTYKGFTCKIKYTGWVFCGYVIKFSDETIECFTLNEQIVSNLAGIYNPHGGFTDNYGFDCAHVKDLMFNQNNDLHKSSKSINSLKLIDGSFKSEQFVTREIEKIVDSIIELANIRKQSK